MTESIPLNVRKRQATRDRIAACAATLVAADGLAATTVERIAAEAEVGRATFFRYFASKEDAVANGITRHWLGVITAQLAAQPSGLSARDAVVAAFCGLGDGFDTISDQVRELAILTRSSQALNAWTLHIYVGYETAIAELVAPRFADLTPGDARPRLIGALAMASVRIALDDWLQHGGSLPQRVRTALEALSVG
ncbi:MULTISPECIES: TetR family transcriptional regulator [unclassified Mycolicibacterium]|uniref:TetR family transcriptional regulator n=1 Tax=unclassified Mycolicibacterium TaxID=2636767 RepID=UPI0012DFA3EA|nr:MULTISPECIES: TetR family transcriptional regulator [unclassified Mycolicibacterium]MUL80422.1 TetR family transcriptional regulator [Mycolicibacterium sp. CBMA 329]MUL86189.1 TetR family transcriptional regulator [Mycolicibacterium sp. CBMA 331]MUM01148.1 TetR family transcriptional regulator [Mycolicibacterium sp. CBMA 334]MUM30039.1 TetR family transcriptional regulator [Mycolicibacterium sp. CBMA 295]MUM36485.1 TetR family transcriptional regulator [Mycolicibacterium sp. CBMA 247]